jgi:hypothetical protein
MKRALLWLGPLACLALACLYAGWWFTRDPKVVAFERIAVGMTVAEAAAIMGEPGQEMIRVRAGCTHFVYIDDDGKEYCGEQITLWSDDVHLFRVFSDGGRVIATKLARKQETIFDKVCQCVRDPSSLWAANTIPTPVPRPLPSAILPAEVEP